MLYSSKFTNYIRLGSAIPLHYLYKMALACSAFQFFLAIIYLSGSAFFSNSNFIAIGCGIIAITASLAPVIYSIIYKKFISLLY